MDEITITNVGPNAAVTLPYLDGGGIVVLRGNNDRGKTEALKAAKRLVGGNGKLAVRAGEVKGAIEGFGARLTIGASTRQKGECEVQSLEGRLDISDLIQPPIKDATAADKHRIKAILSITEAEADPQLFAGLLPESEFRQIVPADLRGEDLVDLAGKIKRAFEAAALREETAAASEESRAKAAEEQAGAVDTSRPCDSRELQLDHETKLAALISIREQRREAAEADARRQTAIAALRRLRAGYDGPSVADANAHAAMADDVLSDLLHDLEEIRRRVAVAQAESEAAAKALQTARAHQKAIGEYDTILNAAVAVCDPGPDSLAAATTAADEARKAVEEGVRVREAKAAIERAKAHREQANEAAERAARIRTAAAGVNGVLSDAVHCESLTVEDGRLVTLAEDGRKVFYADRSRGARARIALDIAVARARASNAGRAVVVLDQEIWEGLDGRARVELRQNAEAQRVTIYTAEATRDPAATGDVEAEVFA